MKHVFKLFQDESEFTDCVREFYSQAPSELGELIQISFDIDDARLALAHSTYMLDLETFGVLLKSADPDHHKRAGALLHALYKSKPIVNLKFDPELDSVDTINTPLGVSYNDAEAEYGFAEFYAEYHNEMTAFFLAFGYCSQYEEEQKEYSFSYLHDVCRYLKNNDKLSVESLFMLFKSLMH